MNDIEELRSRIRRMSNALALELPAAVHDDVAANLRDVDAMFDAIEMVARIYRQDADHKPECICVACEAFCDVADRTERRT